MNEDLLELAKRADDAGWDWAPGHADNRGVRVLGVLPGGALVVSVNNHLGGSVDHPVLDPGEMDYPDFSDPVTAASTVIHVRAKHGAYSRAFHAGSDWVCQCQNIPGNFRGPTELAAWVAALETER